MLKNRISSPEVDRKIRMAISEIIKTAIGEGGVKISSCEINSEELQPRGYSFRVVINGMAVPNDEKTPT